MFKEKISEDVSLKLLTQKEDKVLFDLIDSNREHLSEWLPWVKFNKEVKDVRMFIENSLKAFANNDGMQCGIYYKNQLAGVIGFHKFDWSNKSTSIGYWLSEKFQGLGLVTAAVKAFVAYAFNELELNRIEIRCAEFNIKSRAIPEKIGFKYEGMLSEVEFVNGKYLDHAVYSFLRKQYK